MNGLEFASALITHLYWPLLAGATLFYFRKPIGRLIGRIRSYEGFGQKVQFGNDIADVESLTERAAATVQNQNLDLRRQVQTAFDPLKRDAEANPSYVILQSWEQIPIALASLASLTAKPVEPANH